MKKIFCDACGKEGASNRWGYRVHLDTGLRADGYMDSEGNTVSGRDVEVDMCNRCYNEIVGAAVKLLKKAQSA